MITIVAEKYDVAGKLAAALDKIVLKSGKVVSFKDLKANEDAVHKQLKVDGYVKISFRGQECFIDLAATQHLRFADELYYQCGSQTRAD